MLRALDKLVNSEEKRREEKRRERETLKLLLLLGWPLTWRGALASLAL